MKHNYKNSGTNTPHDGLKSALTRQYPHASNGEIDWLAYRIMYNKRLRKSCEPGDRYSEEYQSSATIKTAKAKGNYKSLPPDQAKEAYDALSQESQSFVKALFEAGMIQGLRSITQVEINGKIKYPRKKT